MSMKIQKGLVKDQGFPDTTCTYGTCDDGRVYYFIENGILENGNIIASTNLKEAIGHTPSHTSLGLINSNSDILIPFENKVIKLIDDRFLLAERANPISKNVVDAMKDRTDPLAANKLVTTAANNKDLMNAKMGRDGKFVFNNQFSEATIFDIDGHQLDNDYYSYIALDDDTIYFSKNIMDFPVLEYHMNAPFKMNSEVAEQVFTPLELDVTNTGIVQNSVENAFNENVVDKIDVNQVQNNVLPSFEDNINTKHDNNEVNCVSANDVNNVVVAPIEFSILNNNGNDNNINPLYSFDTNKQENVDVQSVETKDEEIFKNVVSEVVNDNEDDKKSFSSEVVNNDESDKKLFSSESANDDDSNKKTEKFSVFNDIAKSSINFNEIKNEPFKSRTIDDSFDYKFEQQDTVIENANNVMKRLIKQNKDQKDTIKNQDIKIDSLEQDNKLLISQCEDVTNQNEDLNRKILRYETIIEKYAKKLNSLSDKVDNQAKTIESQQKRLDVLEPQIAGRAQLGDTLEEAMEILNDEEIDHVYTKFVA